MTGDKRVAVVTESIASIPAGVARAEGIRVIPMPFRYAGADYLDGVDITPDEFYAMMRPDLPLAETSAPSPGAYLEAFEELGEEGYEVLCITATRGITRHYETAAMAGRLAREEGVRGRIEIFDSGSAGMGQGLLVLEAARLARRGTGMDEVLDSLRVLSKRVSLLLTLDTLEYASKTTRVPRPATLFAQALQIKPVVLFKHGKAGVVEKPRTRRRAIRRLLALMGEKLEGGRPLHVSVQHAGAGEEARNLRDEVAERFRPEEVLISEFSLVMVSQTGPGLLGLAFYEAPDEGR